MEDLVMPVEWPEGGRTGPDPAMWRGRRVFLTGHTGFKGSWLALWLVRMGAHVTGYALPPSDPGLFRQARIEPLVDHVEGDIRDADRLEATLRSAAPDVVIHLAAQPLVRESYHSPVETWATNVQGTVNLLDACRRVPGLLAVLCVTSDKCYENREWPWPYRESDPMGGHDPYSSSKGAAELAVAAWRASFFGDESAQARANTALVASARAGNVIGGGDWSADRLVPDIVRALLAGRRPLIRNPLAIRPWQHVLEALGGYLLLAERLMADDRCAAQGWNFGPADDDVQAVHRIADRLTAAWGRPGWDRPAALADSLHEAGVLKLDCAKARSELGWRPLLDLSAAIDLVVDWHLRVAVGADPREATLAQIDARLAASERKPAAPVIGDIAA